MLELREQIDAIIEEGNTIIDWNEHLGYVSVEHIMSGEEYYFQGEEYDMLYADYLNSGMSDEFDFDEFLYLTSQNWQLTTWYRVDNYTRYYIVALDLDNYKELGFKEDDILVECVLSGYMLATAQDINDTLDEIEYYLIEGGKQYEKL